MRPTLVLLVSLLPLLCLQSCNGCDSSKCALPGAPVLERHQVALQFARYRTYWVWDFKEVDGAGPDTEFGNSAPEQQYSSGCECWSCGCRSTNRANIVIVGTNSQSRKGPGIVFTIFTDKTYSLGTRETGIAGAPQWYIDQNTVFGLPIHDWAAVPTEVTANNGAVLHKLGTYTVPAGTFTDVLTIAPYGFYDSLYVSYRSGPIRYVFTDSTTHLTYRYALHSHRPR